MCAILAHILAHIFVIVGVGRACGRGFQFFFIVSVVFSVLKLVSVPIFSSIERVFDFGGGSIFEL